MIVSLGRVDALVFTGGIGQNAIEVRAQIVGLLRFAGFTLDEAANAQHGAETAGRITRSTSPMAAVIATNEELMIAQDTAQVVENDPDIAARWGRNPALRALS
jgi:acetate kinase